MIDSGETDWKVIVISAEDPLAKFVRTPVCGIVNLPVEGASLVPVSERVFLTDATAPSAPLCGNRLTTSTTWRCTFLVSFTVRTAVTVPPALGDTLHPCLLLRLLAAPFLLRVCRGVPVCSPPRVVAIV